ncbi:MAG: DUF2185 domain-containing protein [Pseudomonadota bacterium]
MQKKFLKEADSFRKIATGFGSCFATDRITIEGHLVGYMYREEPENQFDSGWRFFAGSESDEYANDPKNVELYDVNTIANYDPSITPYLTEPSGVAFVRVGEKFVRDE